MSEHKFKAGDYVRIVDNLYGHGFEIDSVVQIGYIYYDGYFVTDEDGLDWFIRDNEIEDAEAKHSLISEEEIQQMHEMIGDIWDSDEAKAFLHYLVDKLAR